MPLDQGLYRRTRQRYQLGAASNGRILNRCRWMADPVKESVDLVVAQRCPLLVSFKLGRE
jgi:hypothetical protein